MASGAYDIAMAVGVEKVKDSGYQGLNAFPIPNDGTDRTLTAAAMFSMVAPAYAKKYGVDRRRDEARCSPASRRRTTTTAPATRARSSAGRCRSSRSARMPAVAGELSVFDCAGVADGAAAAIVVRAEDAHRYTDTPLYIKALSFVAGNGSGLTDPAYDYTTFPEIVALRGRTPTRRPASPIRARELAMAEVHDCFTPDRARADGGPRVLRAGHGVEGGRSPARSTSTATCRSTPTAASRASATRSARAGCA